MKEKIVSKKNLDLLVKESEKEIEGIKNDYIALQCLQGEGDYYSIYCGGDEFECRDCCLEKCSCYTTQELMNKAIQHLSNRGYAIGEDLLEKKINKELDIVVLVGCSGAGKDEILKAVLKLSNFQPFISYTTRPIRSNETNGIDYHFVSKEEFESLMKENFFIESRVYHSKEGDWYYGLSKTEIDKALYSEGKKSYIVVLDYQGLQQLKNYIGEYSDDIVTSVFINVDEDVRRKRVETRQGRELTAIEKEEIERRIVADRNEVEAFKVKCDRIVLNNDLSDFVVAVNTIVYSV